jgi:hypothetical protein
LLTAFFILYNILLSLRLCFYLFGAIYMSGYTDDVIAHDRVVDAGIHFIQKPFSINVLAAKVREVLDE